MEAVIGIGCLLFLGVGLFALLRGSAESEKYAKMMKEDKRD